ncbi:MAG: serine aminopeptidase domain-containing protein [bacterium]
MMLEQPFFFGETGKRIYGVMYYPAEKSRKQAGWILCAPFGIERINSRRFMVEWARELSSRGYWVLRFDYRGRGDSEGPYAAYTPNDHVEDILTAVRELENKAGVPCRGLCGLRLGAALAVEAAIRTGGDPMLALWEPVVLGKEYINELLRAALAGGMIQGGESGRTRNQLRDDLENDREVVVHGHYLTRETYHAISAGDLLCQERPGRGPVLILNIQNRSNPQVSSICELLKTEYNKGGETTLDVCQAPVPWTVDRQYVTDTRAIFGRTWSWIEAHDVESRPRALIPAGGVEAVEPAAAGLHVVPTHPDSLWRDEERLVQFTVRDIPIWGILKRPVSVDRARPLVIMQGRRALYRSVAEELAKHGWASLCFDPRGFGESLGGQDFATEGELFYAMETGLMFEDCVAAVNFAERGLGFSSCVLIGLCGDAITSVLVSANDGRVRGIVPLELPFRQSGKNYSEGVADHLVYLLWSKFYMPRLNSTKMVKTWKWVKPFILTGIHYSRAALSLVTRFYSHTNHLRLLQKKFGPRLNKNLFYSFVECLQKNLPVLCLFGNTTNFNDFSMVLEFLSRRKNEISLSLKYHVIPKADHAFSHPNHTRAMSGVILEWLENTIERPHVACLEDQAGMEGQRDESRLAPQTGSRSVTDRITLVKDHSA